MTKTEFNAAIKTGLTGFSTVLVTTLTGEVVKLCRHDLLASQPYRNSVFKSGVAAIVAFDPYAK